jgi:hypothetical protein
MGRLDVKNGAVKQGSCVTNLHDLTDALIDPAGQEHEHERLRSMGKWRFILLRGIIPSSGLMFLLVLSHISEDLHSARSLHESTFRYLLGSWARGSFIGAFVGSAIGILAWRRLVSDVWPGAKPDPESSITTLGLGTK